MINVDYKEFPSPIEITKDGLSKVVGWAGNNYFVVQITGKPNTNAVGKQILDGEDDVRTVSLWEWGKEKGVSLDKFEQLQKNLETYINVDISPKLPEDQSGYYKQVQALDN